MTYEYFKQHWQNECLKDGVLTIPDGIEELYQNCGIAGNKDIRKVVFPEDCYICIGDPVFQDCSNLEIIENLSPILKRTEEFVDEETGETMQIEYNVEIEIHEECFLGCTKLFEDRMNIDEDGFMTLPFCNRTFPIGYHESRVLPFYEEMKELICDMYEEEKESYPNKSSFTFKKNIIRYNNEYEYLFENGALYNVTTSSFVMFLADFSTRELITPEWIKQFNLFTSNEDKCGKTTLDVESLQFIGDTSLESINGICFPELIMLTLSKAQVAIPKDCFCDCGKLQEIVFPTSIKYIGFGAFRKCKSLKQLDFSVSSECHPYCTIDKFAFYGCTTLKYIDFSGIDINIERDAFSACSSLQEIKGLADDYVIYGGGFFHNSHLLTVLNHSELRYPEGAEWLDDTSSCSMESLYLPASIKYIESKYYKDWNDWEPVYMRAQKIVVPVGYKDYFIKLFMKDWGEPTIGYSHYGKYITRDFVEVFNELIIEQN